MNIIQEYVTDDDFLNEVKKELEKFPSFYLQHATKSIKNRGDIEYTLNLYINYKYMPDDCSKITVHYSDGEFKVQAFGMQQVEIFSSSILGCLQGFVENYINYWNREIIRLREKWTDIKFEYKEVDYDIV